MSSIDSMIKKAEKLLSEASADNEPEQKNFKLILYDVETRQTVYETPESELIPVRPGESRTIIKMPHNYRDALS